MALIFFVFLIAKIYFLINNYEDWFVNILLFNSNKRKKTTKDTLSTIVPLNGVLFSASKHFSVIATTAYVTSSALSKRLYLAVIKIYTCQSYHPLPSNHVVTHYHPLNCAYIHCFISISVQ